MSVILEKFLVKNNYNNFKRRDISLQLQTHPQYPSFRAFTDTLDYFGIDNVAATVPEDSLPSLPNTFLTIIDDKGSQIVLVVNQNDFVYCYSEDGKKTKYKSSDFVNIWSKEIIAIEDASTDGGHGILLSIIGVISGIAVLVAFLILRDVTLTTFLILLFSSIGLFISLLLVKEKIGYHSASVHSICTSIANTNCDEVINSKGSMMTKHISLADAGFMYFAILIFHCVFFGYNSVGGMFILISLPVIFYSIYYQAIVLKKWCPLCLGVAAILVILNVIVFQDLAIDLTIGQISEFLMAMAILIPLYLFIKNLVVVQKNNEEKLYAASSFKRNPDVIKSMIQGARTIEAVSEIPREIRIGNPEAVHKIIAFTNPFCGFCESAFENYVKITKAHSDIEIWIRFNSEYDNFESISTKIVVRLVELYDKRGQASFINAYLDWFGHKNEKEWFKKYGNPKFDHDTISLLKSQQNWAVRNAIAYTPATIIGGKEFPSVYGYEDLPMVISDIFEYQEI